MSNRYDGFLVFKKHTSHGTEYFENMMYYLMTSPVPWYMRWRWVHINLKVSCRGGEYMMHFSLSPETVPWLFGFEGKRMIMKAHLGIAKAKHWHLWRCQEGLPSAFKESTPCLLGKEGASYSLYFVHSMVQNTQHLSVQISGCRKHLVRQILKGQTIQLFVSRCTGQITSVSGSSHRANTLPSFQEILWRNERARLTSEYKDEGRERMKGIMWEKWLPWRKVI